MIYQKKRAAPPPPGPSRGRVALTIELLFSIGGEGISKVTRACVSGIFSLRPIRRKTIFYFFPKLKSISVTLVPSTVFRNELTASAYVSGETVRTRISFILSTEHDVQHGVHTIERWPSLDVMSWSVVRLGEH